MPLKTNGFNKFSKKIKDLLPDARSNFAKEMKAEIVDIIVEKITSGISPVKGQNRYPKYSDSYSKEKGRKAPVDLVESGQMLIENTMLPMKSDRDPQAFGSSVTYGKRYSLMSILGLATEDDDGRKGRVNFDEVLGKLCFADNLGELSTLSARIKNYEFPKWQKVVMEIMADRRKAKLKEMESEA